MAAANPYPDYKNSGLNWVSRIPAHWETCKLKYAATFNPSRSESIGFRINDALVSFLPMKCVTTDGRLKNVEARNASEVWEGFTYFRRNDVVIAKITPCFENGKGGFLNTLPTEIGFGSTEFIVLRAVSRQTSPAFLAKLLSLKIFRALGADAMTGAAGQQRVPLSFVKNFRVVLPPCAEQDQIVAYLRVQDAHIARFIKAKRELIGLLHEQKLRIIDRAVTRGLDPTAKLKPSGIEWLGEVPEHWEVQRLKNIANVVLGKMLTTEAKGGNGGFKPYLRSTNVQWFKPDVRDVKEMWIAHTEMQQLRICKGDLLVSEGGEVGRACIWDDELAECYIQNSVHRVAAKPVVLPEFLLHQFFVNGKRGRFNAIVNRVSIAHLTREKLVTIPFTVPPIAEQQTICRWIEAETQPLDEAVTRAEEEIRLIREYRDRLILDVVTGQIDVRGWQPGPDDMPSDDVLAALGDDEAELGEEDADDE
ncbi:restriction endonuclease subunit S [Cardiobacterium hominis]|uniref:restriction endonuclease subunit S n=1 Tax=Cardiobacterium hominis TaxID=2718 RepID=UPI0028D0A1BD|nr:restriction endonuclease subunit S [Cardiobacterium hominis]